MLSPKQAAERLKLSPTRVRALIASGALAATNIGLDRPVWAIEESELGRFAALSRPAHRPRSITVIEQVASIILDNVLISLGANDPDLDAWAEVQRINAGAGWSYDKSAGRGHVVNVEGVQLSDADLRTAYDLALASL